MDRTQINEILQESGLSAAVREATPFLAEEDGAEYSVWKITTDDGVLVLKDASTREAETYHAFFPLGGPVPKIYSYCKGHLLMEFIDGHTLSRCSRKDLILTLDALIAIQKQHWNNAALSAIGYGFEQSYPNREKRLPYMEDLGDCYKDYLEAFRSVPRTLCNDDLLPFNIVISGDRAVILDWEYGGILPYPCSIARLLAFGEENEHAMFFMTREDRIFAVEYYYENLVSQMGIGYDAYIRTLKLFFFKEYSEWIYCANSSGDFSGAYYQKYSAIARKLAAELGY